MQKKFMDEYENHGKTGLQKFIADLLSDEIKNKGKPYSDNYKTSLLWNVKKSLS